MHLENQLTGRLLCKHPLKPLPRGYSGGSLSVVFD